MSEWLKLIRSYRADDGTFRRKNDSRVFSFTRFDIYMHRIYDHMNLWPRTPPPKYGYPTTTTTIRSSVATETTKPWGMRVGEPPGDPINAWNTTLEIIKFLGIGFGLILIVGLLLRCLRILLIKCLRKCCRKCKCCKFDPDATKILRTKRHRKVTKLHHRILLPFYMMVMNIIMFMFEKHEQMPPLRRIKE